MVQKKINQNDYTLPTNNKIRKAGARVPVNQKNLSEYIKCSTDFIYFCTNYVKILTADEGLADFIPRSFQKEMYKMMEEEQFLICKIPRRYGKTTIFIGYFVWKLIFNDYTLIGIFADKEKTAKKILKMVEKSYENLPLWMQQGVKNWSSTNVIFENGSLIDCGATTESSGRCAGYTYVLLDEFAFVPDNIQDDFYRAVYPVITSGANTKIFIVSTPHGMNLFYKIWDESVRGENQFRNYEVHWSVLPGRDEIWRKKTISNIGHDSFEQEFNCSFIGSAGLTLISIAKLKMLTYRNPVRTIGDLDIYYEPEPGRVYTLTVDTARGGGGDFSAMSIIDITNMPYIQVASYKSNIISQMDLPVEIYKIGKLYNNAYVLIEINDGLQVGDFLWSELEYPAQLFTYRRTQNNSQEVTDTRVPRSNTGIQMTKTVKKIACTNLKTLIEADQLIVNGFHTIAQLKTFIQDRNNWSAEAGKYDDLVMTLCLFSWLAAQKFFRNLTDENLRENLQKERLKMEDSTVDRPFKVDGINPEAEEFEVFDDMVWHTFGDETENPVNKAWRQVGCMNSQRYRGNY